jgi:hypothetical protein
MGWGSGFRLALALPFFKPPRHTVHNITPSPFGDELLCPAFNPPDIQAVLCFAPLNSEGQCNVFNWGALCGFVVQKYFTRFKTYPSSLHSLPPLSFQLLPLPPFTM